MFNNLIADTGSKNHSVLLKVFTLGRKLRQNLLAHCVSSVNCGVTGRRGSDAFKQEIFADLLGSEAKKKRKLEKKMKIVKEKGRGGN